MVNGFGQHQSTHYSQQTIERSLIKFNTKIFNIQMPIFYDEYMAGKEHHNIDWILSIILCKKSATIQAEKSEEIKSRQIFY